MPEILHRNTLFSHAFIGGSQRGCLRQSRKSAHCGQSLGNVAQALAAPHAIARDMVTTVEHPTAGPVKMLGIESPTPTHTD